MQSPHMKLPRNLERTARSVGLLAISCIWLSSSAVAADPSFLKGIIDGCIDAQRRMHAEQKKPFDSEFVREYCYCQAPTMADLLRTAESRDKLRRKDPQTVAAIQQLAEICDDGVRNGRQFAPPVGNPSNESGRLTPSQANSNRAQDLSPTIPSFDAFSKSFRCPESLPNDQARESALRKFLDWAQQRYPDLTTRKVVELRTKLLEEHRCDTTLARIRSGDDAPAQKARKASRMPVKALEPASADHLPTNEELRKEGAKYTREDIDRLIRGDNTPVWESNAASASLPTVNEQIKAERERGERGFWRNQK